MTQLSLRRAVRTDAASLIHLIIALADFEKLPSPDAEAQARLIEHGFGARPKFEVLLAEWAEAPDESRQIVGYAFFFETYSTFLAHPSLYLEDLFVLPDYRGRGIGSALLQECIETAHARGCGRMEWTCLDWNTNAQAVYEKLGARRMNEWYLYRLTSDTLERLANKDKKNID